MYPSARADWDRFGLWDLLQVPLRAARSPALQHHQFLSPSAQPDAPLCVWAVEVVNPALKVHESLLELSSLGCCWLGAQALWLQGSRGRARTEHGCPPCQDLCSNPRLCWGVWLPPLQGSDAWHFLLQVWC